MSWKERQGRHHVTLAITCSPSTADGIVRGHLRVAETMAAAMFTLTPDRIAHVTEWWRVLGAAWPLPAHHNQLVRVGRQHCKHGR